MKSSCKKSLPQNKSGEATIGTIPSFSWPLACLWNCWPGPADLSMSWFPVGVLEDLKDPVINEYTKLNEEADQLRQRRELSLVEHLRRGPERLEGGLRNCARPGLEPDAPESNSLGVKNLRNYWFPDPGRAGWKRSSKRSPANALEEAASSGSKVAHGSGRQQQQ